jgi:hypothetical protein
MPVTSFSSFRDGIAAGQKGHGRTRPCGRRSVLNSGRWSVVYLLAQI